MSFLLQAVQDNRNLGLTLFENALCIQEKRGNTCYCSKETNQGKSFQFHSNVFGILGQGLEFVDC